MHLFPKILSGMANSVDPDQTAPSGSALFAYVILSDTLVFEILGHLPFFPFKSFQKVIFCQGHLCRSTFAKFCYGVM